MGQWEPQHITKDQAILTALYLTVPPTPLLQALSRVLNTQVLASAPKKLTVISKYMQHIFRVNFSSPAFLTPASVSLDTCLRCRPLEASSGLPLDVVQRDLASFSLLGSVLVLSYCSNTLISHPSYIHTQCSQLQKINVPKHMSLIFQG